jgi:hypothetical protein
MSIYTDRAFKALGQFTGRLSGFVETVAGTAADPPRLPKSALGVGCDHAVAHAD